MALSESEAQKVRSRIEEEIDTKAIDEKFERIVKEGPDVPADTEVDTLEMPDYFDPELFHSGQRILYNNYFTIFVAKLAGLISLFAIPSILNILVFTKQSSTPCTAFNRYVSTVLHTFMWYNTDPVKQLEFFKSVHHIRKKHAIASRRCNKSGLPRISQLDMAVTQFGFVGYSLLSGQKLGMLATDKEYDGFVHMWRIVGYLLGMEDRYNLCSGTSAECRYLCRRFLDDYFLPYLAIRGEQFDKMSEALINGLWPINPHLDCKAFVSYTLHLAISASTNNNHSVVLDTSALNAYSKFVLNMQMMVHEYLMPPSYWWSSIFRNIFNLLVRLSIFLAGHFPFLAYVTYGRKNVQTNMYKFR